MDKQYTIGTTWVAIGGGESIAIVNDGDSDVYFVQDDELYRGDPWDYGRAPLKKGEDIHIDLVPRRKGFGCVMPVIYLICQTGTATVRVFRW